VGSDRMLPAMLMSARCDRFVSVCSRGDDTYAVIACVLWYWRKRYIYIQRSLPDNFCTHMHELLILCW
jgi:hypothetical protein